MVTPKIIQSVFDPKMDPPINTRVLRAIYENMGVEYCEIEDRFTAAPRFKCWGISIEDQHDKGEPEPHYILKVGEGDFEAYKPTVLYVRYCDNHSTKTQKGVGKIKLDPGTWKIRVWASKNYLNKDIALAIN
ncbi:hypothetical protein IKX64_02300, partial [Candidatus Saccharibacteria bacterium]|nr:hypothetical protein [Candidatus Saccharibacteria bacterium]